MGKSWERRPHRKDGHHGRERNHHPARRACCPTFGHQPHASSCRRDPRECGVKQAFVQREARARVTALVEMSDMAWRAYRCYWCGLFHLTTKELER